MTRQTKNNKIFEKSSVQLDKGIKRRTQSAEDNSARTRQWTFKDKGSRYQVFGGGAQTGWSIRQGGVVATRGREKSLSSGRAGTLFRLRAYMKISRPKHNSRTAERTTKAKKKLWRSRKYRGPWTLCEARIGRYDTNVPCRLYVNSSCIALTRPAGTRYRTNFGGPRNALVRYLGVLRRRQNNTIADGNSERY